MAFLIKPLTLDQYEQALALWQTSEGIGLSAADSPAGLAAFLERNPGLSFVALAGQELVGVILCGHDGRRGYIHHLAVKQSRRRQGLGRKLVHYSLAALQQAGIDKCHIFVFRQNQAALDFWQNTGWVERVDLTILSRYAADR